MRSGIDIASVFCLKYTKFVAFCKYLGFQDFFNEGGQKAKNFSTCVKGLTFSVL